MPGAGSRVRAGKAFIEISLDQTKLERGLKAAQARLKAFGASCMTLGTQMLGIATAAATPFAIATKTFADFDDAMRTVRAVTGSTKAEFEMLTDTAERLGRETSFTAKQVAEGMASLGRMGFKADEINQAIGDVLNLSRATGTELASAAEIAANNMRVFGMQASQVGNMADILTSAANGSAQTLTDLSEGLKMAGPQAAAAGDSFTNVAGALGVLANMGIKGSLAGTSLRNSYSQFAKVKVQDKLKSIGISTVDRNGNLRAMPDIMADIARAMNKMPTAKRLTFAEEIFDLRGSLAGLQLGGNIDQLNRFIASLKNCGGAAKDTAEEMDAGIGGAFRRIMSAAEGVMIQVGRVVAEAIAPYVERMTAMLGKLAEWVKSHKQIMVTTVKLIAGIAAAGTVLIALGVAFKTIAFAIGTVNTLFVIMKTVVLAPIMAIKALVAAYHFLTAAMAICKTVALATWAAITSPAFLVGAALAAIVAVVWKLTGAWDICKQGAMQLGNDIKTAFNNIKAVVGQTFGAIKQALAMGDLAAAAKVGWAAIKVVWFQGLLPLRTAWAGLVYWMRDAWDVCGFALARAAVNTWYGILYGLKEAGDAIADTWDFLWTGIVNAFEGYVIYPIMKLGATLWHGMTMAWTQGCDAISDVWAMTWNGIVSAFEKTIAFLKKQWIKFKGFFDDDVDVDREIAKVDAELARGQRERDNSMAASINGRAKKRQEMTDEYNRTIQSYDQARDQGKAARDQRMADNVTRRQKERDNLKGEWNLLQQGIEQAQTEALMANKGKYDEAVAEAGRDLAAATAEWQEAVDAVKKKANAPGSVQDKAKQTSSAIAASAKKSGMATDLSGKTAGSFSAKALGRLIGGNTAAERTAKATEASKKQLERLNGNIERQHSGGAALAYGS